MHASIRRQRLSRAFAAAFCAAILLFASGCLFSQSASSGDGDEQPDATVDAADAGEDGTSGCATAGDCPDRANATATCTASGQCEYSCSGDYINPDDDFSDGCECTMSNSSRSWADCDGDGFAGETGSMMGWRENDRITRYCTEEFDRAQGTPEAACGDDGGQWVARNPSNDGAGDCDDSATDVFPGFPGENVPYEEAWLCDGTDNDCDGTTDEACCGGPDDGYRYGDGSFEIADGSLLRVTDPVDGAPEGAVALAVWKSGDASIRMAHIGVDGESVGSVASQSLASGIQHLSNPNLTQLAVATGGGQYQMMVGMQATELDIPDLDAESRSRLYTVTASADLSDITIVDSAHYEANELGGVRLHVGGDGGSIVTATAAVSATQAAAFEVRGCQFTQGNPSQCSFDHGISRSTAPGPLYPALAATNSGYVVGWWDQSRDRLSLVYMTGMDGAQNERVLAVDNETSFGVTPDGNTTVPIELAVHEIDTNDDDTPEEVIDVIYPDFDRPDGNANLKLRRLSASDLTFITTYRLANATGDYSYQEPSAVAFEGQDKLIVSWRGIDFGEPETGVATATYSLDQPSPVTEPDWLLQGGLADVQTGGISATGVTRGMLTGWVESGSTNSTHGHFLSLGGKPICAERSN